MSGARMGQHADDLDAALPSDGFELGEIGIGHQASASMKPAMASTWTPVTAISGVYTTSSAAHTIVPRASLVTPATLSRTRMMLSLMRTVLALRGGGIRPSRMMKESPTTVLVKSPARSPLIGYVYQMRPT